MEKIKILIADDHAIVRMGLTTLLSAQADLEVVGEATNGEQAITKALRLRPDIVVMDLAMPKQDGIAATAELHARLPACKCLILTSFGSAEELQAAVKAGAAGILLKSTANHRLVAALRKLAAGKSVFDDAVEPLLAARHESPELSPRQREILESITRGFSNADIALQLGISPESVKTHMTKLFAKIGAANRAEAVALALKHHLLKL